MVPQMTVITQQKEEISILQCDFYLYSTGWVDDFFHRSSRIFGEAWTFFCPPFNCFVGDVLIQLLFFFLLPKSLFLMLMFSLAFRCCMVNVETVVPFDLIEARWGLVLPLFLCFFCTQNRNKAIFHIIQRYTQAVTPQAANRHSPTNWSKHGSRSSKTAAARHHDYLEIYA